jgi:protein-L-isoaspartate O-methyltransferase
MARMISPRATWTLLRAGNLRGRLRVTRDGQAAIRLNLVAAALATGVLDALAAGPATAADVAIRISAVDLDLLGAFLRVLGSAGVLAGDGDGPWRLTAQGRAAVEDDLVRASCEAFTGFHTGLYRELRGQLTGGPGRRDVVEQGGVIARVSAAFDPFVDHLLVRVARAQQPRRVLDVGCGAGLQLATMLETAAGATGVGIDSDGEAIELATGTLERRGLTGRAALVEADVRTAAADRAGPLAEPFDLALLANVVYYVPRAERTALFREIAGLLAPGGQLVLVTTEAAPQLFSRHFDLLLRAQEGAMELPEAAELAAQLEEAGLRPQPPIRLAPGNPIIAVRAVLPG